MTVVQICGTSGAGKSTLVRNLMLLGQATPLTAKFMVRRKFVAKIIGYRVLGLGAVPIYVVGSYANPCGGCDQVGSWREVARRVDRWAKLGHVVFEGLLLSGGYGSLGRHMEVYGDRFVYACLDTPLARCLARVNKRRRARGVLEPVNPKNTTTKWAACQRFPAKLKALGRRGVVLDHQRAEAGLLRLLGVRAHVRYPRRSA